MLVEKLQKKVDWVRIGNMSSLMAFQRRETVYSNVNNTNIHNKCKGTTRWRNQHIPREMRKMVK
jgi:hypothetical protein